MFCLRISEQAGLIKRRKTTSENPFTAIDIIGEQCTMFIALSFFGYFFIIDNSIIENNQANYFDILDQQNI